jgi:hypothetical protein
VVRSFVALAAICVAWLPQPVSAGLLIEFELDLANAAVATIGVPDPTVEEGPFTFNWDISGVEETIETFASYTGIRPRKKSELPPINRQELFAGMWTKPSYSRKRNLSSGWFISSPLPSMLPPFNPRWLVEDMWPLTRCYLDGNDDENELEPLNSFYVH